MTMLNFDYSLTDFKNQLEITTEDNQTLEDLYTLARDNIITLDEVSGFVDGLETVSLDTMLHTFNYRSLDDILDTEPVRQIGDRWII